jgi:hypothetical protein
MESHHLTHSQKVYSSSLNLFDLPPSNIGILSSEYLQVFPQASITDTTSPIIFNYSGTGIHYLDLSSSFIHIEAQVLKHDGKNLTSSDDVTIVEDIASAIFSSSELLINAFPVFRSTNLFQYACHLRNLLGYGEPQKSTELSASLWYPDEKPDTFNSTNKGFVTRKKLTDLSKKFDLVRKVQISLFECHRPLPPETDFQLTFRRGASPFCLVGSKPSTSTESTTKTTDSDVFPYKLQISKCSLFIRKMILHENIVKKHQALLSSGKKFIYPCKHIDIKAFAIPSSTTEYISEIIYSTTIPQFLAVALVTTAAYHGDIKYNPYKFSAHNLASVSCLIDNDSSSYRSISFGPSGDLYVLGYYSLFQSLSNPTSGNGIKREDYVNKHIVLFELLPSKLPNVLNIQKKGQIKVDLKFHSATTEPLMALIVTQFDTIVEIEKDRTVFVDSLMM